MSFISVRVAAATCLLFIPATLCAADSSLTLKAAIDRTLTHHPDLAGFEFAAREQSALSEQARLRPSPQLGLEMEEFAGSGDSSGFNSAQATLSFSQVLELGGKRGWRSALASAQGSRLHTAQSAKQLDVLAQLARSFVNALAQQERMRVSAQRVGLAKKIHAVVKQRVDAALAPEAERSRALVALAEAELALEDARHGMENTRAQLAAAMGLAEIDFDRVAGDLYGLEHTASYEDLIERLERNPDFLWFADEQRVRDAQLRLAQSQARRNLRLSLGVRYAEQTNDTALVAGFSLPLFASARARSGIEMSSARVDALATEKRAAFVVAKAHLRTQVLEMEHARHVSEVLQQSILPQLEGLKQQTEQAYVRGRYSYLELSDAQSRLLNARLRRIEAAAEFQTHRIEIERLTGVSLADAGVNP